MIAFEAMALVLAMQSAGGGIGSQFDLNTAFLTILLALAGWTLHGVQRHEKSLTQVEQQLWGKDGKNGHSSELRNLDESIQGLERYLRHMERRIVRLELRSKLGPLP